MLKHFFFVSLLFWIPIFSTLITDTNQITPPFASLLEVLEISPDLSINHLAKSVKDQCSQLGDRWTFENRFEEKREMILPILETLGCFQSIHASQKHYRYGVVLGALRESIQRRFDFLIGEWKRGVRFDQIVFLTGERTIRESEKCKHLNSEREMMVWLWNQTEMPSDLRSLPLLIIDSPAPFGRKRATTKSTLISWKKTNPDPGSALCFSSQPYIGYQDAVIKAVMPSSFQIETVGPEGGRGLPTSVLMDNLAKWLEWTLIQRDY